MIIEFNKKYPQHFKIFEKEEFADWLIKKSPISLLVVDYYTLEKIRRNIQPLFFEILGNFALRIRGN